MKSLLYLTVAFHYVIFISFILTVVLSWTYLPWYLYFSLGALIIRVITSRDVCPLTQLENIIRQRLGLRKSSGFLNDWILFRRK